MNNKLVVGLSLIVILVFIIVIIVLRNNDNHGKETTFPDDKSLVEESEEKDDDSNLIENTSENIQEDTTPVFRYISYTENNYETNKTKKRVLFFHANWCPTCRAADTQFMNRLEEIPSNVVLLKTDYDSESDLKKKYDVSYQHTFVQVDENGELIKKWNGGDIEELVSNIQ